VFSSLANCRNPKLSKRVSFVLAVSLAVAGLLTGAACVKAAPAADPSKPFEQKLDGTDVSFKMVPIPAGAFLMGSPESEAGRAKTEGPQHEVKIDPFFMEEHEVTWAEYNLFLNNYNRLAGKGFAPVPKDKLADAVTFPTPMYDLDAGPALQRMGGRTGKFPAVIMSQYAAKQYTKWLSKKTGRFYRLPSEAEWEYAARAGTKTAYFFGDDPAKLGDFAWFKTNSNEADGDTGYHPIMSKKPNPWGLYDIYGNASEWCIDQYAADWYAQFGGKSTEAEKAVNWPKVQYPRVLRGGNYDSEAAECRSAARMGSNRLMNTTDPQLPKSPHWMSDGFIIGFRVIAPVKEPSEPEKLKWWDVDDPTTAMTIQRDREQRAVIKQGPIEK
jgi:formylglycine-generating enzyme required for sulfatase activity